MAPINIAVTGCGHGELDIYYRMCKVFEEKGRKIDLLLITGDFQAIRNQGDLGSMNCPLKYKHMMNFYKYYSGEKVAPILTIYVGGNHEASNYHKELHYGGWVAPNIYFMGHSNVIRYKGLRIGGISGIHHAGDFKRGYYEQVPFNASREGMNARISAYHTREIEINKLMSYNQSIDIMLSHDWPSLMYHYGNVDALLQLKPHFKDEIDNGCLGSPPLMRVLRKQMPSYWFAAHMHVKFAAIYPHPNGKETRFLALDKCDKRREYMQVVTMDVDEMYETDSNLYYDPEWLGIVKEAQPYLSTSSLPVSIPERFVISSETRTMLKDFEQLENCRIPQNFKIIAPIYHGTSRDGYDGTLCEPYGNNQTDQYIEMLKMEPVVTLPYKMADGIPTGDPTGDPTGIPTGTPTGDPNELNLDDIYTCLKKTIHNTQTPLRTR